MFRTDMIRRDYIIRMIEEFVQVLARMNALKRGEQWQEASGLLDSEFQRLMGEGAPAILPLSETELFAKIAAGEPSQVVRQKAFMLATLLGQAGDVAAAQDRMEESHQCYLKALHLLLDVLGTGDVFERPEFVPKIESLVQALGADALPTGTQARLMQHYERTGEFGKAEDALFGMLEVEPDNPALIQFGLAFYRRLLARTDTALNDGNLPRLEVEQATKELEQRLQTSRP